MTPTLESLATCLQGLLPAQLFTCSSDGIPNAAYLSHVEYVDGSHVALSFQFFNKSRRNVAENPHALVIVPDPDTGQEWQLRLKYVRSETEGPLFDRMNLRIEAIASYTGLKGIFKLRAADIYEVRSIEPAAESMGIAGGELIDRDVRAAALSPIFTMKALQDFARRLQRADSLEALLDSTLEGIEEVFGFKYAMVLVPAEEPGVLVTIATRGYEQNGVGAEVRIGEGIAGLVAEARKPIRISGLMCGMLYAYAMHHPPGDGTARRRPRIPLPGLPYPESQLGVPLMVRGELVGVLCLESETPYRFHEEDKASIELLGHYVAIAMQNMQVRERSAAMAEATSTSVPGARPVEPAAATRHELQYYAADECILLDGEYLVRSLPARILWRLMTVRQQTGRDEFTNRELRLDKSLQLPEWKDNLESRLILLRRRLEQKCPDIRIVPCGRGRFRLEVSGGVALVAQP